MPWPGKPAPPQDRTLEEAEREAQKDYARLLYAHSPSWTINVFTGEVRWACSCSSPGPRNAAQQDKHILEAVRQARGPKPYKRT